MTWALFLVAKLRPFGGFLGGALRWLFSDFRHLVIAALAIGAGWLWLQLGMARQTVADWQALAGKRAERVVELEDIARSWQATFTALTIDIARQRAAAKASDEANARRVEREFAAITERTEDDFEARLADSAAALERVRGELARAGAARPGGSGGGEPDLSGNLSARCRALGAADCDALLAALPDQLAAAEANTAKLIALQDWARQISLVDLTGEQDISERTDDASD